jgi:hypothetical protein
MAAARDLLIPVSFRMLSAPLGRIVGKVKDFWLNAR